MLRPPSSLAPALRAALAVLALWSLCALPAPAAAAPQLSAVRVATAPTIDGRLDDEAWRAAPPSSAFTQKYPAPGAAPGEATTLRVVYDDEALYFAFDCAQTRTKVVRRLSRRDREVEADWVGVSIDSRGDGTSAFEFQVNAAGVLRDALRWNDTDATFDWDENWEGRAALSKDGWTAELRVPLRALRFPRRPPGEELRFGLQARRYVSQRQELDEWSYIPRTEGGEVSRYGRLLGLRGLRPGGILELRPFVVGRVLFRDLGGPPDPRDHFYANVGLDAKIHLGQDLTLDLALQPDFGQVEADQAVLNLTTYEVFFPERRPFFLEGLDIFQTPLPLLYTRRIGRPAQAPAAPEDLPAGALVRAPTPPLIYGAAKLGGRIGPRLTVGLLAALTSASEARVDAPHGAAPEALLAEPLRLQSALRLRLAIGKNAHLGILGTASTFLEDPAAWTQSGGRTLCPGGAALAPGERCLHHGFVSAIDGRWRSPSGDYALSGQLVLSARAGGAPEKLPDGTVLRPGDVAPGGLLRLAKEGGRRFVWTLEAQALAPTLDFNDLGYMRRQNLLQFFAQLEHRTLEPWRRTLETHNRVGFFSRDSLQGRTLFRSFFTNFDWTLRNFYSISGELKYRSATLDDRELGDGTALERGAQLGGELGFATDRRRAVFLDLWTELLYVMPAAAQITADAILTLRPLPQLDLQLQPEVVYAAGEPRYVGAGARPGSLLFGRLEARSVSATLRATYTFTPRLSLQVYAQILLAARHYDRFFAWERPAQRARADVLLEALSPAPAPALSPDRSDAVVNLNAVLRWEYLPGSVLFLVYTRSQAPDLSQTPGLPGSLDLGALRYGPGVSTLLLKMSFWYG